MKYDEIRGYVPVLIDGEDDRFLRYDQRGIRLLMDALALESAADLAERLKRLDPAMIGAAVWAGLQHEGDCAPTREDVDRMHIPIVQAMQSIERAIHVALFGAGGSADDEDPTKARRSKKPSRKKQPAKRAVRGRRSGGRSESPTASA